MKHHCRSNNRIVYRIASLSTFLLCDSSYILAECPNFTIVLVALKCHINKTYGPSHLQVECDCSFMRRSLSVLKSKILKLQRQC